MPETTLPPVEPMNASNSSPEAYREIMDRPLTRKDLIGLDAEIEIIAKGVTLLVKNQGNELANMTAETANAIYNDSRKNLKSTYYLLATSVFMCLVAVGLVIVAVTH